MFSHTGGPDDDEQKGDSTFSPQTPHQLSPTVLLRSDWALGLRFMTPTDDFPILSLPGELQGWFWGFHPMFLFILQFSLV